MLLVIVPLLNALTEKILVAQLLPELAALKRKAGAVRADNSSAIVALNSLDLGVEYSTQLVNVVRQGAAESFGDHSNLADEPSQLIVAFGEELKALKRTSVEELAEDLVPRAWLLLEWQMASYLVSTPMSERRQPGTAGQGGRAPGDMVSERDAPHAQSPIALAEGLGTDEAGAWPSTRMLRNLVDALEDLKGRLRKGAHADVVEALAAKLAEHMEEGVMSKKFDELGAIQFQDEFRRIVEALGRVTETPVRHCFARLTQIAFLLNAASVNEAVSLMAEASALAAEENETAGRPVRLTPAEACRVVSLRVEFADFDFEGVL